MTWNLPNILTVVRLIAALALPFILMFVIRPVADWIVLILFLGASFTDYLDGLLARAWKQTSRFGAMLDPIADKAMVVIALVVVVSESGLNPWILAPTSVILFREVFVSGLREFLGATAGLLKVTVLAKWKTTVQMLAVALLFTQGIFQHYLFMQTYGMNPEIVADILSGATEDTLGLVWKYHGNYLSYYGGVALLWLAALLTFVTGLDYFVKSLPYLKDDA